MEDGVFDLDEYAGPDGYAASTVMPARQGLLRFMKASKAKCKSACDADKKCVGFKHGNGGCSLMRKKAAKVKKVKKVKKAPKIPKAVKRIAKAPVKVSQEKATKAKLLLKLQAKSMTKNKLKSIALRAKVHAKRAYTPHPAKRNKKRAAKRVLKNAVKADKRKMTAAAYRKGRRKLIHSINKNIRIKLRDLPANTKAGSQRKIAVRMMKRMRARFTRRLKRRVAKKVKMDTKRFKKMLKKAPSGIVSSGVLGKGMKKADSGFKNKKRKLKFKVTRADIHHLSPTLSKKADNLKGCSKLKHMCKVSRRVRKQCPHTCYFLKKLAALKRAKVLQAKKVLVKRRLARDKVVRKKVKRAKLAVNESYEKNARLKEKSLKARLKIAKLKKQIPKPQHVRVKTPREIAIGKERAWKVKKVMKVAKKWEKKGVKTIRKGKKVLKKASHEVKHERKKTKRAKQRTTAVVMRKHKGKHHAKGSTKLVKPKQKPSVHSAVKDAKKVRKDLKKGYKEIKRGKPALERAQRMLKVAIRNGQGKPVTKSQNKLLKKATSTRKGPTKKQLKKLAKKNAKKVKKTMKYHHGVVTAEVVKKPKTKRAKRKAKKKKAEKKARKAKAKAKKSKKKPSVKNIKKKDGANAKKKKKALKKKAAKKVKGGKAAAFTNVPKNAEKLAAKGKHLNSKKAAAKAEKKVVKAAKKAKKVKKVAAKAKKKAKKAAKKKAVLKKKAKAKAKAKGGLAKKKAPKKGKALGASMGRQHLIIRDKSGCNYQPPAGCGCSGTVLPQQTEPNELGDSADPTSTNNCPKMPADCACRVHASSHESLLAATELVLAQESSNAGSAQGSGIVCRIRAAIKLVQVKYPVLMSNFKASAAFKRNQKAIAPLLSCVQDAAQPNKACEAFLPQAMSAAGDILPKLAQMKDKVAKQYRKEITQQCE